MCWHPWLSPLPADQLNLPPVQFLYPFSNLRFHPPAADFYFDNKSLKKTEKKKSPSDFYMTII